jgi:ribosomal protein L29
MDTLDAARKAKAKANKEFRKKSKAKLDKALKSLKKNLAAAKAGADAAHAAQEALRLKRELDQKLDHEKQMSERVSEFKSKYPNVWALGKTGLLWAQASLDAKNGLNEDFVKDAILKNLAADCVISKKRFGRNFRNSDHHDAGYFRHKLFCIVSETYADTFMDEMQSKVPINHASPNIPLDIVFSPIVTGSKSYIEWARKHTNRVQITANNLFSKH